MQKWQYLKEGDTVAIIAPASLARPDLIENAKKFLEKHGLKVQMSEDMYKQGADPFSANSLEYRAEDFKRALDNPDVKAIWAIGGGYGSMQLIPFLSELKAPSTNKVLIGFSDITSLHLFFNEKWEHISIHGDVLWRIVNGKEDTAHTQKLMSLLKGDIHKLDYNLTHLNDSMPFDEISGEIVGGNMALVQSSLGTDWQINCDGKIVFFEDIGVRGYSIDRTLEQFKQIGLFDNCKAVIFGDFTEGDEKDGSSLVDFAINKFAEKSDFPVFKVNNIGHGDINYPLVLGSEAFIIAGEDSIFLSVDSGGYAV